MAWNLSGTLYLPVGYDMEKKEKAPMILWAYPREYKDKSSAGQTTANPNRFTYPYYGSAIYWVTKGYVVLDGAAFPIVGEGDEEPNDSFREQLVANAKAAIDAVDELGYIDRNKVAAGDTATEPLWWPISCPTRISLQPGSPAAGPITGPSLPLDFRARNATIGRLPTSIIQCHPLCMPIR